MKPAFTLAAISDIHVNKYPIQQGFFDSVNENADILLIGGDMNDGEPEEVEHFLQLVSGVTIPIIVIFGNHDCSSDNIARIKDTLSKNSLIKVLDGDYVEFNVNNKSIGIAGAKAFGGGFTPHRIVGRGEAAIRSFLQEEDVELTKLNSALNIMKEVAPEYKIVLTHWAAFVETIEGEPLELYPVLGSSRFGDIIESVNPDLVLSGHAHHGPQGIKKARGLISACNIAYKVNDGRMLFFDFFSPENIILRHDDSQSENS